MIFIRIALTAVLLWAVYGETGAWTTAAFALIALTNELTALWMRGVDDALKGQGDLERGSGGHNNATE